jgi:hypothetical protein
MCPPRNRKTFIRNIFYSMLNKRVILCDRDKRDTLYRNVVVGTEGRTVSSAKPTALVTGLIPTIGFCPGSDV